MEFSPAQVEDLRLAAEEAGFSRVAFITEPEAAGYAFCRLSPEHAFQHRALIVDWGGGTLDMAVVERSGDKVGTDRKFTAGLNDMGGERFDSDLWNHVSLLLQERNVDMESEKPAVRHAAQVQVHKLKESLSQRDGKELRLATSAGPTDPVAVSRTDFEKLIGGSVQKAADQVCRLAKETSPEMLLLVGGTSLIPLVRQEMERQTGLTVCQWQYTREAVAIGAALWNSAAGQTKQIDAARMRDLFEGDQVDDEDRTDVNHPVRRRLADWHHWGDPDYPVGTFGIMEKMVEWLGENLGRTRDMVANGSNERDIFLWDCGEVDRQTNVLRKRFAKDGLLDQLVAFMDTIRDWGEMRMMKWTTSRGTTF